MALTDRPVAIVLPHREVFSPAGAGAVAMVVHRLAAGGSRYRATVLGPPFTGPGFPEIAFRPVDRLRWLPGTPTQRYAIALAMRLARMPPGLIEVHNKPDVAMILARLFPNRPVSLMLHNDPRTMRGANSPRARAALLGRLAQVLTVSDFVRRGLLDGVTPGAWSPAVLHNAIDPAELPAPALRDRLILFAGRVVPDKAPDAFVAACAAALPALPGWRAEIIGSSGFSAGTRDSPFIQALRPAAAAAGVTMLGYRPQEAVLRAMARAAIVVVPSRWDEPFGLAALEAMAAGAAVACSMRGGLAEVVGEAGVLADPDDPAGMARTLVALASDANWRGGLAAAGLKRVQDRFMLDRAIATLDGQRDQTRASAAASWSRPRPPHR